MFVVDHQFDLGLTHHAAAAPHAPEPEVSGPDAWDHAAWESAVWEADVDASGILDAGAGDLDGHDPDGWAAAAPVPGPLMSEGIPSLLSTMTPGPALAALLSSLDRTRLNGHELVIVMQARARQLAHDQAELYADMREVSTCPPGDARSPVERDLSMVEFAADEIRAALTMTRRAADNELDLAWQLTERLPRLGGALGSGVIDLRRARTMALGTEHLDDDLARAVIDEIIEEAPGLTTGQLAARLRKLCITADPDDAAKRYRAGHADRRVEATPNPDGTANLWGRHLPPDRVSAIRSRLERLARSMKSADDERTIDQLRADVFVGLLDGSYDGRTKGPGRGVVDIVVDLETLAGLAATPGEIPGWGPVIADIARKAITDQPDAEWRVAVTDPDSGAILWNGTTRRRPTAAQARHVQTRDAHCVFPGCRMPARQCDLDHIRAYAEGGPTHTANTAPLCSHDHHGNKHGNWKLRRTSKGRYVWTSPLGHVYRVPARGP